MRRSLVALAALLLLLLPTTARAFQVFPKRSTSASAPSPKFRLISLGDWGDDSFVRSGLADAVAAVAGEVREPADRVEVALLGDNFYPTGVESATDAKWSSFTENFNTTTTAGKPVTYYAITGNHDWYGNVSAQPGAPAPGWHMPSLFYSEHFRITPKLSVFALFLDSWSLIGGDTPTRRRRRLGEKSQVAAQQYRWIEERLSSKEARDATWIVVALHYPLYSPALSPPAHGDTRELIRKLEPLFLRYNVRLVLQGHDHMAASARRGGVHYLLNGAAALPGKGHDPRYKGLELALDDEFAFMYTDFYEDEMVTTVVSKTIRDVEAMGRAAPAQKRDLIPVRRTPEAADSGRRGLGYFVLFCVLSGVGAWLLVSWLRKRRERARLAQEQQLETFDPI